MDLGDVVIWRGDHLGVPLGPGVVTDAPMLRLRPAVPFGIPKPMVDEWGSSLDDVLLCGAAEVETLRATLVPFVPTVPGPVRGVPGLLLGVAEPGPLGVEGSGGRDWFRRWRVLIGNFVLRNCEYVSPMGIKSPTGRLSTQERVDKRLRQVKAQLPDGGKNKLT